MKFVGQKVSGDWRPSELREPAIGQQTRVYNNNNNNNNHSLIYAHIYSRPTAQVHTVSKYTQI